MRTVSPTILLVASRASWAIPTDSFDAQILVEKSKAVAECTGACARFCMGGMRVGMISLARTAKLFQSAKSALHPRPHPCSGVPPPTMTGEGGGCVAFSVADTPDTALVGGVTVNLATCAFLNGAAGVPPRVCDLTDAAIDTCNTTTYPPLGSYRVKFSGN